MQITVKYSEYCDKMNRSPETVNGSYNAADKTIAIRIKDDAVEYLKILNMTDDQLMEMGKSMYGDSFNAASIAENRKALLDYFRDAYCWSESVTMAVANHF